MPINTRSAPKPVSLENVQQQFQKWRATRTEKNPSIPDYLWKCVDTLMPYYGRGTICRRLGVSTHQIKKHCSFSTSPPRGGSKKSNPPKSLSADENIFVTSPPLHFSPTTIASTPPKVSCAEFIRPDGTRFLLSGFSFEQVGAFFDQWLRRGSH